MMKHRDLVQLLIYTDKSQKQIVTGIAVRKGFEDRKFIKRIESVFDFHVY